MKLINILKSFKRKTIILTLILSIVCIYLITGFINTLTLTEYDFTSSKVPAGFDGFRIVQISDFHCKDFGYQEADLINMVKSAQPDIIVLTGDSIDDEHTIDNYAYLLEGIHDIAPIYYITGNHEFDTAAPLETSLELHERYGVIDLNTTSVTLTRNNDSIVLSGLGFCGSMFKIQRSLDYADTSLFNILLYHCTDQFDAIAPYNYDLVLSGHTHGGLVCLPFIGGIITNQKELFPKYDSGAFTLGQSTMISSRGLGDASVPRFHNPREVVCVTLHSASVK